MTVTRLPVVPVSPPAHFGAHDCAAPKDAVTMICKTLRASTMANLRRPAHWPYNRPLGVKTHNVTLPKWVTRTGGGERFFGLFRAQGKIQNGRIFPLTLFLRARLAEPFLFMVL